MRSIQRLLLFCIPLFSAVLHAGEVDYSALVAKLADDNFETRAAARQQLQNAGDSAKAALEAALKNADADSNAQITELLEPIRIRADHAAELQWLNKNMLPVFGARTLDSKIVPPRGTPLPEGWKCLSEAWAWLAAQQEPDGHWDSLKHGAETEADLEQTALVLLTLAPAAAPGEWTKHKPVIQAAADWLSRQMNERGEFATDLPFNRRIVPQAFATAALSEAAMWTRQPAIKKAAEQSARALVKLIAANRKHLNALSVAIAAFGLKQAKFASIKISNESFDDLVTWLLKNHIEGDETRFCFDPAIKRSSISTLAGSFSLAWLGWAIQARESIRKNTEAYMLLDPDGRDTVSSLWLLCQRGYVGIGAQRACLATLAQRAKDHQAIDGPLKGSVAPNGYWAGAGRLFSTAFGAFFEYSRRSQVYGKMQED